MKMKLLALALLSTPTMAFAWCANGYSEETCGSLHVCYQGTAPACPSTDPSGNTNTNTNGNSNTNTNGNSNNNLNGNTNNNSNKNSNKNTNTSTNTNTNKQNQQQQQAQYQGQSQGQTNDSHNTAVSTSSASQGQSLDSHAVTTQGQQASALGNTTTSGNVSVSGDNIEAQARNPVNTAYAPPVTVINSDSCKFANSLGGQAVSFGFSFSGNMSDEVCERLKLSRELRTAGHADVADELLKQDERVAKAFEAVGNKNKKVAFVPSNVYDGKDVIIETKQVSINQYR